MSCYETILITKTPAHFDKNVELLNLKSGALKLECNIRLGYRALMGVAALATHLFSHRKR